MSEALDDVHYLAQSESSEAGSSATSGVVAKPQKTQDILVIPLVTPKRVAESQISGPASSTRRQSPMSVKSMQSGEIQMSEAVDDVNDMAKSKSAEPQKMALNISVTPERLAVSQISGLASPTRQMSVKNRLSSDHQCTRPPGVKNKSPKLSWESNKVEQIINETKSLLDDPGAVHDETRRFQHRSHHTNDIVKLIRTLSITGPSTALSSTATKSEDIEPPTPTANRKFSKTYSTKQSRIMPMESLKGFPAVPDNPDLEDDLAVFNHKRCCVRGRISVESNFSVLWDFLMLALLLYVVFVTPFMIAFEELSLKGFNELLTSPHVYVDILIDLIFLTDVVLNFVTTYHDDHGEEQYGFKKIAYRYLETWFIIDLLSCIPFDLTLIIYGLSTSMQGGRLEGLELIQTTKLSRIFKSVRIFRLTKAVRVIKAFKALHVVEKFMQFSDYHKTQFLKSMVLITTLMHLLTCAWVFIGVWDGVDNPFLQSLGLNGPHDSWIVRYEPWQDLTGSLAANMEIYVNGLLFVIQSFTTVGYGDVSPTNTIERIFAIFLCFFGALLYGYVIAAVTSVVLSWNQLAVDRHKRMDEITSFMRIKKFPTRLRTRIYAYFYKNLIRNQEISPEYMKSHTVVLEGLSVPLRKEVTEFLLNCAKGELIANIPIFGRLDRSHMALLMPLFKRDTIPAESDIITQGERNWEMFVLMGGKAFIRIPIYSTDTNPDSPKADEDAAPLFYREEVLEPGACFGVMQMLGMGDCKLSVVAKTACDVWSMSGHDVHHAFKLYPTVVKHLKKTCSRMYARLLKKGQDKPNDPPARGVNLYMETVARFHISRKWKLNEFDSDWFTRRTKKKRAMRALRVMGLLKPKETTSLADRLQAAMSDKSDDHSEDTPTPMHDASAGKKTFSDVAIELISNKMQTMEERLTAKIELLLSSRHHHHKKTHHIH